MTPALLAPPLAAPTEALLRGFVVDDAHAPEAFAARTGEDAGAVLLREGFRVGTLRIAMRYEDGHELLEAPPVHALPNVPRWFRGMANMHGALVPVFDAAALFGIECGGYAKPMLLVVGRGEAKAGLLIDGLPERLRLRRADRVADVAVPPVLAGCTRGAYWCDGADWVDLDVPALLDRIALMIKSAAGRGGPRMN